MTNKNKSSEQPTFATFPPVAEAPSDLPALPEPNSYCTHADTHEYDVYDAEQMRDYARSALSQAQTAQGVPIEQESDKCAVSRGKKFNLAKEIMQNYSIGAGGMHLFELPSGLFEKIRLQASKPDVNSPAGKMGDVNNAAPKKFRTIREMAIDAIKSSPIVPTLPSEQKPVAHCVSKDKFSTKAIAASQKEKADEVTNRLEGDIAHLYALLDTEPKSAMDLAVRAIRKLYATKAIAEEAVRNQALYEAITECNKACDRQESQFVFGCMTCMDSIRALLAAPSQGAKHNG